MDRDACVVGEKSRQRRAFVSDHVHVDAMRCEGVSVILHAGTASEIPQHYDGGAHHSSGTETYYNPARNSDETVAADRHDRRLSRVAVARPRLRTLTHRFAGRTRHS